MDLLLADVQTLSDPVQKIVAEEMARLILHDASRYPLPNTKPPKEPVNFSEYSAEEMAAARAEIDKELPPTSIAGFEPELWDSDDNVDEIPSSAVEAKLTKSAPLGNKLEKKLSLTLGGYQSRQNILSAKIKEVTEAIEQAKIDLAIYQALQVGEQTTAPLRIASLLEEVEILEQRERSGQRRYKELNETRGELLRAMGNVNGH